MKITIVGAGYVGLSLGTLMAQYHEVAALEIDEKKIEKINNRISPIEDKDINSFFKKKKLNIYATSDKPLAYKDSDFIVVCTPTNYDSNTNEFDTSTVRSVIHEAIKYNSKSECIIVIKSTIPVGFTKQITQELKNNRIIFSPEFLREGKAIYDNLNPSRIIVGDLGKVGKKFSKLLVEITSKNKKDVIVEFMDSSEAEAVKLFSNTYLAMRIAYFNELDTYCEIHDLNSSNVIRGIGHDSRIGNYYNNPSFGYGGYCLPKDSQQLLKNYNEVPNKLIKAIVEANITRKDFIAEQILNKNAETLGIYRLVMKEGSGNIRESAVQGIINRIKQKGIEVIIYEPKISNDDFLGSKVINDLNEFINKSDLIIANRFSSELIDVKEKVYTRDLFNEN